MKTFYALVLSACVMASLPVAAMSATVVNNVDGPYDIASDTLFTGIAESSADGAGSYIVEFFTSGASIGAIADAAVTTATVNASFTDLTMSWIDGLNFNTIVAVAGIDTLSTVFDAIYPVQQLRFDWTDSVAAAGFRFDVTAAMTAVPVPGALLLLGSGGALMGLFGWRRRGQIASV